MPPTPNFPRHSHEMSAPAIVFGGVDSGCRMRRFSSALWTRIASAGAISQEWWSKSVIDPSSIHETGRKFPASFALRAKICRMKSVAQNPKLIRANLRNLPLERGHLGRNAVDG